MAIASDFLGLGMLGSLIGVWLGDSRVLVWALPAQPGPVWCSDAPGPLY